MMVLKKIPIHELEPAAYNPRVDLKPRDPVYDSLKLSIETFGCLQPIIWNTRTGKVVGGHQRLAVLKDLRHMEAEVVVVDLSIEEEKALNLALNKIGGEWDQSKLAVLLKEFEEFPEVDVRLTGFDDDEIGDLVSRMLDSDSSVTSADDDFDVGAALAKRGPAVTQPGELFLLGDPRLLCEDATNEDHVRMLMDGEKATLFATDPLYLVGYDATNHPGSKTSKNQRKNKDCSGQYGVAWDDSDVDSKLYEKFYRVAIAVAVLVDAAWYCWHASRRQVLLESVWTQFGAFVHQQIIWVKDRPILNRSWYSWQHEPCFFGWVRPHKPRRVANDHLSTIWRFPTVPVGQPTEHPTSKPVELFAIPMRQHPRRGEICYEPFCGSGSQLIAAEQLGRRCFALEISPHYCDVIVRRWIHCVGPHNAPSELVERFCKTTEEVAS